MIKDCLRMNEKTKKCDLPFTDFCNELCPFIRFKNDDSYNESRTYKITAINTVYESLAKKFIDIDEIVYRSIYKREK